MKRVKQLRKALFPRLNLSDVQFVDTILDCTEKELFSRMSLVDQRHCVDTALMLRAIHSPKADPLLLKAALLHDIGKSKSQISLGVRVLFVILNSCPPPFRDYLERLFPSSLTEVFGTLFSHPQLGAEMGAKHGLEESVVQAIRYHHNPIDDLSRRIQFADDRN